MDDGAEPVVDAHTAREALAMSARAGAAGERAARRLRRRHLLFMGAGFAGWVLVNGAVNRWVGAGGWPRPLATAVLVGVVFGLVAWGLRAEPVRAVSHRRMQVPLLIGGCVVFAVSVAVGPDYPAAYPIGAVVTFGYWAWCAWWTTRER
jgi:hypothetical protein